MKSVDLDASSSCQNLGGRGVKATPGKCTVLLSNLAGWPPHLTFLHACPRSRHDLGHPSTKLYVRTLDISSATLPSSCHDSLHFHFDNPALPLPSLPLDTPTAKPASTTPQRRHDAQSRSRVAQGHLQQDEEPRPDAPPMVVRTTLSAPLLQPFHTNPLFPSCQICEKACRDENAYKMHCQSPSHTRKALEVGQNFKGAQEDFSRQFERDFVQLLKTAHGEKEIHANKFYQEVIANKEHVHLNATKWHSLTDFVKHLARSSICRVEEKEDGLFIAWIDDSEGAIKRREVARRKELQDRGDEEREQGLLREQIRRARKEAEAKGVVLDGEGGEEEERKNELVRAEGEKISMSFGPMKGKAAVPAKTSLEVAGDGAAQGGVADGEAGGDKSGVAAEGTESGKGSEPAAAQPVSLKFGAKPKPKNVFKNAFAGAPKKVMVAQPKKMSEAERIMKEEMERKRSRESGGGPPSKKMKFQF